MIRAAILAIVCLSLPAGASGDPAPEPLTDAQVARLRLLCAAGCDVVPSGQAERLRADLAKIRARLMQIEADRAAEVEARKWERCS